MITIYWAGDSTVQYNDITTYPQTGLGQVLGLYLKPEIQMKNYAKNGASSKSFYNGPRLPLIREGIQEGDFFFIEFGHNDEKPKPDRHTEPFTEFGQVLEQYVNIARDKGAHPVLITPLERRCFGEDGKLGPGGHADWL